MPNDFNGGYPSQYESRLTLKNGREVFFRPVLQTDGPLLVNLFNKLSPQSVYFRFLRTLHALTEDLLYRFTHVDYHSSFALLAVIEEDEKDAVIGVGRYAYDQHEDATDLAVAVRDDWQNLGLGSSLIEKTIAIGKEHGIFRFVSVMDPGNNAIRHIFQKFRYKVKYFLRGGFSQVEILVQ